MALVPSRRGFITGAVATLVAAPAVVSAASLMRLSGVSMAALPDYAGSVGSGLEVLYGVNNSYCNLLTIDMTTREAVRLVNSNKFIADIDKQYGDEFAVAGAKIGSRLRIRLPNDYVYNKARRTLVPRAEVVDDLAAQLPVPLAIAGGIALAASRNPVVSRRFWSRGA